MIGQDLAAASALVLSFRRAAVVDALGKEMQSEFDELALSTVQSGFPGALLVWPRPGKCSVYYAVASNASEWRRLRPLLTAYAGPTLTSFTGWPEPLLPHIPVEAALIAGGWHIVARLVPGASDDIQKMTRRSLMRMLSMTAHAPANMHAAPVPTSRLLAQFTDCLNGNDYAGAERILETCKTELRIDALNLSFLRIRLLSHFNDWSGIVGMPQFSSLCHTRKPPVVAANMLEALYQTALGSIPANDPTTQQVAWRKDLRALARPLLVLPIPQGCRLGTLKLYAWEALESEPRRPDLESAVLKYRELLGAWAIALDQDGRSGRHDANETHKPLSNASIADVQRAIVVAEDENTLASIADALTKVGHLDSDRRKELLASEPFRSAWQNLMADFGGATPPTTWVGWLHRLSESSFTSAFSVLQHAVAEWPSSLLADPAEIAAFSTALAAVPETMPASERLADALPFLVAWVADDPQFPRAGMISIYETLLYHLVSGVRRGRLVYDSAALLIRALLSIGVTSAQYKALLDDCLELAGDGVGKRSIYWVLDVLEETIASPTPSPERRQAFWYAAHARLLPLRAHFSPGQRVSFERLATSLGWELVDNECLTVSANDEPAAQIRAALAGTTIAIYTLTESAARQAVQALAALAPDARITVSSDTGGSAALKSMAQTSDLFIVATASAKHAATGYIQQMRPREKPLLFAAGRGFTSIVRAIEDYVLGAD